MKKHLLFYGALGILSCCYLALTMTSPLEQASRTFQTSSFQLRLMQLSIVLPVIIIWFVALWGSLRFKDYAKSIISSKDGSALNVVANGLLILVFGLAVSSTLQSVQPHLRGSPRFNEGVIMHNYLDLFIVLVAFGTIYKGAWKLVSLVKFKNIRGAQIGVILAIVVIGILFAWLLAINPHRQTSPDISRIVPYYLPDWLLITTLLLPYLVAWFLGFMAAICVHLYQKHSAGIIYRRAAQRLSVGLLGIVGSSVLIQALGAIGPSLSQLKLAGILGLLYLLLIAYGVGHVLVATGAKQLAKLEKVG